MSIDPRFERMILAEMLRRERRARQYCTMPELPHALGERLSRSGEEVMAHLRRVAARVPHAFRAVAWLHHAHEAAVTSTDLAAAGFGYAELRAIELLRDVDSLGGGPAQLDRVRAISRAPGTSGEMARVVARVALKDRIQLTRPCTCHLAALRTLDQEVFR